MDYCLLSNGRLLDGVDEVAATVKLQKITGRSPRYIRDHLLSGKRVKLTSGSDHEKLQALHDRFRRLGLDVVLEPVPQTSASSTAAPVKPNRRKGSIALALLLGLLAAVGGYLWYWMQAPLPAQAQQAESALADGQLVLIAHVDADKVQDLERLALGGIDPQALPMDDGQRDLLGQLFDGPARLRDNLKHGFFTLHTAPELSTATGAGSLLLTGRFERDAVLETLRAQYRIDPADADGWLSLSQQEVVDPLACPSVPQGSDQPVPLHLQITPDWLLLTSNRTRGELIVARLKDAAAARQDIAAWKAYRQGKLASVMVLVPGDAAPALGGLAGMLAAQSAEQASTVTAVAASVELDLLQWGLHGNLRLTSADSNWNRATADALREGMASLRSDSRKLSPSLAEILRRITVADQPEAVTIDLSIDRALGDQLGQVAREAGGQLFSVRATGDQPAGERQEQIDTQPADYTTNVDLQTLPALSFQSYETKPLFLRAAYGVNLESARLSDDGVLELRLAGLVGMPETRQGASQAAGGELRMQVDSVTDANGNDLLRDERCLPTNAVVNNSRNHEAATTEHLSIFQNKVSINKSIRLREGVRLEELARIRGKLALSVPTAVQTFTPKLQVGEVVELTGLRFYLSGIGDDSVSYQVSGDTRRLLEVRALNADGKVLRKSWRMDSDKGRFNQSYEGTVHGLQVFVAERFTVHQTGFVLTDIFRATPNDDRAAPQPFVPPAMAKLTWADYAQLKLDDLSFDPNSGYVSGDNKTPVASASWPGVKMFVTHTPSEWGNAPQAHIVHPMLPDLPGVLSALSYQIEQPTGEGGVIDHYLQVSYPYYTKSGEWVIKKQINGQPLATNAVSLETGLEKNARLDRLKGKLVFRQPLQRVSSQVALKDLWRGVTIDGVAITLTEAGRGMFPGYALKLEGDLTRLVNVYGLSAEGARVRPEPVNFQSGGYWTMTLPFGRGIQQLEIVTAVQQKVVELPFDLRASYP